MQKVYVFLADGFEEIEGLTVVDILRRGNVETVMVSVTGDRVIHGAHGIDVHADAVFENVDFADAAMLVLPGGGGGTKMLSEFEPLTRLLKEAYESWNGAAGNCAVGNYAAEKCTAQADSTGTFIAAICAAPSILGGLHMLEGRKAVCYPGFEEKLLGAEVVQADAVVDGNIITGRAMGGAAEFALTLLGLLKGKEKAEEIRTEIVYNAGAGACQCGN